MTTLWIAVAVAIIYSILLCAVAIAGDRGRFALGPRGVSWAYGLSIAVYATSWTFFGAVGTAVSGGLEFLPIYLGPILLFALGYPLIRRTLRLGKAMHSTSIADFLSSRYGKNGQIAALITLIATIGLLPYIALQLKSVAQTLTALSPTLQSAIGPNDIVLLVAAIMAGLSILLGTRHIDLTRHNRGLVLTMAVEALVKLAALLAMAGFALWLIADADPAAVARATTDTFSLTQIDARFWTLTLLAACAALCLPRQFHMTIVEAQKETPDRLMRWVFPAYLMLVSLAVIPIVLAALPMLSSSGGAADMAMVALPLSQDFDALAILVFLGGFAAASGMIIVSTVVLSNMITNDLIVPALYARRESRRQFTAPMGHHLLWIRRGVIVSCLAFAYLYFRTIDSSATLAGLGTLSFAAVAQFAPGLIGGLYWERGNAAGMRAGLLGGFAAWLTLRIVPAYLGGAPLVLIGDDALVSGVLISLTLNSVLYLAVSAFTAPNLIDQAQAVSFVRMERKDAQARSNGHAKRVADLRVLLRQFVGEDSSRAALTALQRTTGKTYNDLDPADDALITMTERHLSGLLGASSARSLITSTLEGDAIPLEEVAAMFDEASQRLQFSGELLQTAIENIDQGVAVVDKDMRLVAWNNRYVAMFDLPTELVSVGQPIADLIAFNLARTTSDDALIAAETAKRIEHMQLGRRHSQEREQADGRILRIVGNPTPQKGYVTSYTDITADRRQEQALEQKVAERTEQLTIANAALEQATRSKTRFLAAASHDLVQPMNAARLFTSALAEEIHADNAPAHKLVSQIDHSITMADNLLRTLLDISKLDGGGLTPKPSRFAIGDVFADLEHQFTGRATQKGLGLSVIPCSLTLNTDKGMVVSILQNLVSNAIRYTDSGRVVLGARRRGEHVEIQILDNGPGIDDAYHQAIFEEFRQLPQNDGKKGVGLGLALAQRLAGLLDTDIRVQSILGRGSCFSIALPTCADAPSKAAETATTAHTATPSHARVLCVDNDPQALDALSGLLTRWGCTVEAMTEINGRIPDCPDLLILDYQLDNGVTGDQIYARLIDAWQTRPPVILLTADNTDETERVCADLGFERQLKPASPMALRALMGSLLQRGAVG